MSDHGFDSAAAQLGMSAEWLRKAVKRDKLPHQQYGRAVRFTDEQIAAIKARYASDDAKPAVDAGQLRPSTRRRTA